MEKNLPSELQYAEDNSDGLYWRLDYEYEPDIPQRGASR